MCDRDLDSIVTYLSQKLNRIFCDREFVSYVNEDLQLVLKEKRKCALVFPALDSVFLKAVYFQAQIFDLGVFYVGSAQKRSIVVCHKEYLQEKSDETLNVAETPTERMNKEDVLKNNIKTGKKVRPALQLYVPPAQRVKRNSLDSTSKIIKNLPKAVDKAKSKKFSNSNEIIPKLMNLKVSPAVPLEQSMTVIQSKDIYHELINRKVDCLENLICDVALSEPNKTFLNLQSTNVPDVQVDFNVSKCAQREIDHNESINNVRYIMQFLLSKFDKACLETESLENCTVDLSSEILKESSSSVENNTLCYVNIAEQICDKNGSIIKTALREKNDEMDKEKEEMRRAKKQINRKSRPIMKYLDVDNDTLHIGSIQESKCSDDAFYEENLTNWEDMFNDEGEIKEKLAFEISKHIGSDAKVLKVAKDYSAYQGKIDDLEHVVEIYDFPKTFQTHDIIQLFHVVNNETMYVKWVDDTHALLVLSSPAKAQRALQIKSDLFKSRPMCAASSVSIETAYKSDLKPAMKRPQTNLLTARRMISSHLGTEKKISKEAIEHEKKLLREAREQRRLEKQNERDAWDGNPRPSTA